MHDVEKLSKTEAEALHVPGLSLTQEEVGVALLLIDGNTRTDILRKLHISAADSNRLLHSIREKMSLLSGSALEQVISSVIQEYKLTDREIHVLRCLGDGMTNPKIAEELAISEATVKVHVHNLMKKLPVGSRQEIPSWLKTACAPDAF